MPIAFVPDWRKSDYVDQRSSLDYGNVKQGDLIPLPRIEDLKNDFNSNFTYLTMFRGKYMDEDRTPGAWSHDGVDIRAPIWTPIFAIANAKVVKVRDEADNKYITLEHRDVKYGGKVGKFYSSYLHLSAVLVQPGDVVDKWTMIGRVGMTGMTTTPHLHIQVDNDEAPFYPYWPFTYSEAAWAGLNMYEAVDAWLNQDLISKYSVDPLDFIKNARTIDGNLIATTKTETVPSVQTVTIQKNTEKVTNEVKNTTITNNISGKFSDVSTTHSYYNSISYFTKKGILKGYSNNTFGPEKNITRAEFLALLMQSMKIEPKTKSTTNAFNDIPKNHWVNNYIGEAVKRNIIKTTNKSFRPDAPITRIEFMAMLVSVNNDALPPIVTKVWKDVVSNHWSYPYALFAFQNNLFEKIDGNEFKPNISLSRGEVAEALYRYLKLRNKL